FHHLACQPCERRAGVTAIAEQPKISSLARLRDPAAWMQTVDIIVVLLALSLPWSTSLVGIFGALVVIAMLPTLDGGAFIRSLQRPICALPIAFFLLALVGTL